MSDKVLWWIIVSVWLFGTGPFIQAFVKGDRYVVSGGRWMIIDIVLVAFVTVTWPLWMCVYGVSLWISFLRGGMR